SAEKLDHSASALGVVRDPSGHIVAGATIVFAGPEGELGDITDDVGAYTITKLAPGDYRVFAFFGNARLELKASVVANTRTQFDVVFTGVDGTGSRSGPSIDVHSVSAR